MGVNLMADGTTFRVWAARAQQVYVCYDDHWESEQDTLLTVDQNGYRSGFVPGVHHRTQHMLYVVGMGPGGLKRDPCYARELTATAPDPSARCVVRDPSPRVRLEWAGLTTGAAP